MTLNPVAVSNACGETAQSGTDSGNALFGWGTPCVTGSNAGGYSVSSVSYWVGSPTSTSFDLGVYADSSGSPGSLLCHAPTGTITPSAGWNSISISGCPTISANTQYWVGYINGSNQIVQGTVGGVCPGTSLYSPWTTNTQPSVALPSPFGATTASTSCYSMYMTLNAGSGQAAAATPTLSPGGGTYTSAQSVAISDTTSGATIYYTTDGSTPTTSSNVYNTLITVSSSETIKAIAIAPGYTNSTVATGAYTISTSSPQSGSVSYAYDSLGRLYQAQYTTPSGVITVTYSYDSDGNRTSVVTQ